MSGDSLIECATIANGCSKVGAVGINCTPPRFIHGLILSIRKVCSCTCFSGSETCLSSVSYVLVKESCFLLVCACTNYIKHADWASRISLHLTTCALSQVTDKPILIYPNSGERYDAEKKEWVVSSSQGIYMDLSRNILLIMKIPAIKYFGAFWINAFWCARKTIPSPLPVYYCNFVWKHRKIKGLLSVKHKSDSLVFPN